MPTRPARQSRALASSSTQLVLREAKRLHRAATAISRLISLPVLRRLLAAGAVPALTLPNLYRARNTVQRKHVLRALAIEAGYGSWEEYSRALPLLDAQQISQAFLLERDTPGLKLWFTSEAGAAQFASAYGGHPVRVGRQAVVMPTAQLDPELLDGADVEASHE